MNRRREARRGAQIRNIAAVINNVARRVNAAARNQAVLQAMDNLPLFFIMLYTIQVSYYLLTQFGSSLSCFPCNETETSHAHATMQKLQPDIPIQTNILEEYFS